MAISASMTRTGAPPKTDSQVPSGRRRTTGSFGARLPMRTRIRKSAPVAAICAARNPAPKFRSASRTIPARRLRGRAGAQVVSPSRTAERGVDDAGAAGDQGQQPQRRVAAPAAGAAALLGVDGQVRLAVGDRHDGAVDRAHEQALPPRRVRGRAAQQEEQLAQRPRAQARRAWVIADEAGAATGRPPRPAASRRQTWQ